MSRFKQLGLSFCHKDGGFGIIEAALILPLFLVIMFGVIEFGNMGLARYQSRDLSSAVGDYLQANPAASTTDLGKFLATLKVGTLKNTGSGQENSLSETIKIQSSKTMLTDQEIDNLCSNKVGVQNWTNPWLGGTSADDNNGYYIYVCYSYAYKTITPLSGLTGGMIPNTKALKGKAVAFTYPKLTCPAGQFLSNRGGKPECKQIDAVCPDGQYLKGVNGTKPSCKQMEVKLGTRFRPYVLDEGKGRWVTPGNCYEPKVVYHPATPKCGNVSGTARACGRSKTVTRYVCGCQNVSVQIDRCPDPTITLCAGTNDPWSETVNDGREWPEYTKGDKVFCSKNGVDVLKSTNDCPDGSVQTGISPGGSAHEVWCKPFLGIQ
ncbi:MAG: TadE family protein [bacterium]|jgi:hypothetical protein